MSDVQGHIGMGDDNILWRVIVPRLDRIEAKLDNTIDHGDLAILDKRIDKLEKAVESLEAAAVTPDQVKGLIGDTLRNAEARGWSKTEITLAKVGAALVILSFLVNAVTLILQVEGKI